MKDFYKNTRDLIDKYNQIVDEIKTSSREINDDDDEFIMNFCIYLAHALIKDTGSGELAREELSKTANIINDVIR